MNYDSRICSETYIKLARESLIRELSIIGKNRNAQYFFVVPRLKSGLEKFVEKILSPLKKVKFPKIYFIK